MLCRMRAWLFFFFAGWIVVMTGFVYQFLPETKGMPIELDEQCKFWAVQIHLGCRSEGQEKANASWCSSHMQNSLSSNRNCMSCPTSHKNLLIVLLKLDI